MTDKPKTVAEAGREEGFLKRWSRQKRSTTTPSPAEVEVPAAAEAPQDDEPTPAIDPADLPDIESLTAESDFSVFMRDGVPEELRRLALRKLWLSDPVLANLDGLNDYDEDFSLVGTVVEKVTTAYKAGRGYLEEGEDDEDDEDGDVEVGAELDAELEDATDDDGVLEDADPVVAAESAGNTDGAVQASPDGKPIKPTPTET